METTTSSPAYRPYDSNQSAQEFVNSSAINSTNTKRIIAIVGPTGIGKTQLGIAIAKMMNTEVISVDSLQVYQGGDLLTAKPLVHEMAGVRHHLVNYLEAWKEPSEFIESAVITIRDIHMQNKIPIIVGGSTSLMVPLVFHKLRPRYSMLVIILRSDLLALERRLDNRIDRMLNEGLLGELKALYELEQEQLGSTNSGTGIWKAIGYPELHAYLECADKCSQNSAKLLTDGITTMRMNTKVYARNQMDWIDSTLILRLKEEKVDYYLLDTSDVSKWSENVEIPASRLCFQWLDETGPATNYT